MSEMTERVARAMCNDLGVNPDDWHEEDGVRVYAWQKEASTARAAIAAMEEPTEAMREHADNYISKYGRGFVGPDEVYRAMIAAAVNPQPS